MKKGEKRKKLITKKSILFGITLIGVLFLVFSFYSLLRVEDCVKKGREGVQIMKGMQKRNECKSKYNIKGIIRLDYAPAWFGAGLLFEKLLK